MKGQWKWYILCFDRKVSLLSPLWLQVQEGNKLSKRHEYQTHQTIFKISKPKEFQGITTRNKWWWHISRVLWEPTEYVNSWHRLVLPWGVECQSAFNLYSPWQWVGLTVWWLTIVPWNTPADLLCMSDCSWLSLKYIS